VQVIAGDYPQNAEMIVFRNLQDEFSLTSAKLLYMEKTST